MNIENLLEGEKITICNHHQGYDIAIDDKGLHLDKRFNTQNKREGRVDVRIFINNGISVLDKDGQDAEDIIKELEEAFNDKEIRESFLRSAKKALTDLATHGVNLNKIKDPEKIKQKIDVILIGLVRYFGVTDEDISDILYHKGAKVGLKWDISKRKNKRRRSLYVDVNFKETSISLAPEQKNEWMEIGELLYNWTISKRYI